MFITDHQPLAFWLRLQARIEQGYWQDHAQLEVLLQPILATVDNSEVALNRAAARRADVFALLRRLELLQSLGLALWAHVQSAEQAAGIPALERRIAGMRAVVETFEERMVRLPRRLAREEDLQAAVRRLAEMKSAGQSESIAAERQRLRSFSTELLVVGAEDCAPYESAVRQLHTAIDQTEAMLQALRVDTRIGVRVADELAQLLAEFGIELYAEQPPALEAPQTPAPAEAT